MAHTGIDGGRRNGRRKDTGLSAEYTPPGRVAASALASPSLAAIPPTLPTPLVVVVTLLVVESLKVEVETLRSSLQAQAESSDALVKDKALLVADNEQLRKDSAAETVHRPSSSNHDRGQGRRADAVADADVPASSRSLSAASLATLQARIRALRHEFRSLCKATQVARVTNEDDNSPSTDETVSNGTPQPSSSLSSSDAPGGPPGPPSSPSSSDASDASSSDEAVRIPLARVKKHMVLLKRGDR